MTHRRHRRRGRIGRKGPEGDFISAATSPTVQPCLKREPHVRTVPENSLQRSRAAAKRAVLDVGTGVTMVQRCDWHDLKKRLGEPGRNCYVIADWEVTRIVDDVRFTKYRCAWHVPTAEPRIGFFEKRALEKQDHIRLDARSETVVGSGYHSHHVGDPS